jgi:hypothetical protein
MEVMANQAKMEKQAAQARMPTQPKNRTSQFHPNATATLPQAPLDPMVPKVTTVAQETLEAPEVMDNRDPKAHQVPPAQPAKLVTMDPKARQENRELLRKAPRDQLAPQENRVLQALQDPRVQPEAQAKMVNQEAQAQLEMLEQLEEMANQVPLVPREKMVPQDLLALALTAHRLVWPQVIKHWSGDTNTMHRQISYCL